jgi:hypothetical protein
MFASNYDCQVPGEPKVTLQFEDLLRPCPLHERLGDHTAGSLDWTRKVSYPKSDSDDESPLRSMVLASYIADWRWLASIVPPTVSTLAVSVNWTPETHDSEDPIARFDVGSREVALPGLCSPKCHVVHPPLDRGLQHAKLLLLDFGGFLRIVVASGNLTLDDWLHLGQSLFIVDVPRRSDGSKEEQAHTPVFEQQLRTAVTVLGLALWGLPLLDQFDLTHVEARLVLSVPDRLAVESAHACAAAVSPSGLADTGSDEDHDDGIRDLDVDVIAALASCHKRNGLRSLQAAVAWARASIGSSATFSSPAVYQASSVGGVSDDLLALFDDVTQGAASGGLLALLPSVSSVRHQLTLHNYGAVTSRCFQAPPSQLFRNRFVDLRTDVAYHTKLLVHTADDGRGWFYSGSHNFTADSWCFDRRVPPASRSSFDPNPRNIELGVVLLFTGDSSPMRVLPPGFQAGARSAAGAAIASTSFEPFTFLKHKALILSASHQASAEGATPPFGQSGKTDPAWFHWHKFLAEFHDDFGRH